MCRRVFRRGAAMRSDCLSECRQGLNMILPLADHERESLDRSLGHGEIVPALLTSGPDTVQHIASQPMLRQKAQNV